jgi:hypothetical protein
VRSSGLAKRLSAAVGMCRARSTAGCDLREVDAAFNIAFSKIRAAVELAVATLKTWRMLGKQGGCYRAPIAKFEDTLNAIIGLMFFAAYE